MLIGLIAMGSLALFLNGIKSVSHMQRQQAAVSLASAAMDAARSVSGGAVNAAGTSGLIKGRSQAAVEAVWNAATTADASDTADMTVAWDPETGLQPADQWVPVTSTAIVGNQPFTIDTLIGKCYRLRAASLVSQNCVATNPAPSSDTYVEIYRVRVVVRWDEGSAASGAHSYRVSSLIDPSEDATWNTALKPYAYDDEFAVSAGAAATFHAIVLNDSVDYDTGGSTSPIIGLTQPAYGSVAVNTAQGINGVVFTPPADQTRSGTVTFRYKVQGTSGEISAEFATVTVHILPAPRQDSFTVETGLTHNLNSLLLGNDRGVNNIDGARKTTIVPVWDRATDMFSVEEVTPDIEQDRVDDAQNLANAGISVDGSGNVTFAAPSANNVVTTFYYYLVDDPATGTGTRYPSAEAVEVRITTQDVVLTVAPMTYTVNATTTATWYSNIPWRTLTTPNNAAGNKIRVESISGPSSNANQIRLDGVTGLGTGEVLDFRNVANTAGTYVLNYRVVSPAGKVSATTSTLTIQVIPVTNNVAVSIVRHNTTRRTVDLATVVNAIAPTTGVQITNLGAVTNGNGSCTGMNVTSTGTTLSILAPSSLPHNRTCTFTYRLSTTGTPVLQSATPIRTVTVTVRSS